MSKRRPAFTLLEVAIALTVAAIVMLAARALLEMIIDAADRARTIARNVDAAANGDRILRALLGRAQGDTVNARAFVGTPTAVEFDSWCESPRGWQERCRVRLSIKRQEALSLLALQSSVGQGAELRADSSLVAFGYLASSDTGLVWLSQWERSAGLPLALAIFSLTDTAIVRVGITP